MSNDSVLQSARDSFSFFCGLIGANLPIPMSFTHKFAIAMMEYMEYYINPKQQTNFLFTQHAPPRAGKSVLSTVFALSYLLGRESDKKMILMSASYYTLEQFLLQIKEIITHPVYKIIFPELAFKISESKGSMVIKTSNGGSLLFHSTLSKTPIGSGFHYIWLDDAMHYDAMFSEVQYRTITRHVQNMLTRIQNDPRSKIFLNNQLLGANDISEVMKMNFRDLKIPFITLRFQDKFLRDIIYTLPNGKIISFKKDEFLVPWYNERSQNEAYARIGNDESRIANEYKNEATPGADSIFDWKYVREYELVFRDDYVKKCHKFAIMTDFAFVHGEENDFTVFTLVGTDMENNLYLLDIQRNKYLTTTIAVDHLETFYNNSLKYLKEIMLRVHSLIIHIETTSLPIIHDVQNRQYPVQSLQRQGGMSKVGRAKSVYVRFNARKLHVPKDHHLYSTIKHEVISFTSTDKHLHDDIVDTITDGLRYIH